MGLVCVREDNPLSAVLSVRLEEEDENDQYTQSERDLIEWDICCALLKEKWETFLEADFWGGRKEGGDPHLYPVFFFLAWCLIEMWLWPTWVYRVKISWGMSTSSGVIWDDLRCQWETQLMDVSSDLVSSWNSLGLEAIRGGASQASHNLVFSLSYIPDFQPKELRVAGNSLWNHFQMVNNLKLQWDTPLETRFFLSF